MGLLYFSFHFQRKGKCNLFSTLFQLCVWNFSPSVLCCKALCFSWHSERKDIWGKVCTRCTYWHTAFCFSHLFFTTMFEEIFISCLRGKCCRVRPHWLRTIFLILKTVLQSRMIYFHCSEKQAKKHFWLSLHILILKTYHAISTASIEWINLVEKIHGKISSKDGVLF